MATRQKIFLVGILCLLWPPLLWAETVLDSFDQKLNWTFNGIAAAKGKVEIDKAVHKVGTGAMAVEYEFEKKGGAFVQWWRIQGDWSPEDGLGLWVFGDNSDNYLALKVFTDGKNYSVSDRIRINWAGWKYVYLPKKSFKTVGRGVTWGKVNFVFFAVECVGKQKSGRLLLDNFVLTSNPGEGVKTEFTPLLADSKVQVLYDKVSGGLQFMDVDSRKEFLSGKDPEPLWCLRFRDAGKKFISLSAANQGVRVVTDSKSARMTWSDLPAGGSKITVEVTGKLDAGRPGISLWRVKVINPGPLALWSLDFPRLNVAGDSQKKDRLLIPYCEGMGIDDPCHSALLTNLAKLYDIAQYGFYPSAFCSMQMILYEQDKAHLILASLDPLGGSKEFRYIPNPTWNSLLCSVRYDLPDMNKPGCSYSQPFDALVGIYQGDWYDGCQIYRSWGVRQEWCSKGPMYQRKDFPEWFKKTPLWLSAWLEPDSALDLPKYFPVRVKELRAKDPNFHFSPPSDYVLNYKRKLGDPDLMGFQWYAWDAQNPFYNDFPHYGQEYDSSLPELCPHREVPAEVKKMLAHGVHTILYVNMHLWDPTFPSYKQAQAWAIKTEDGKTMPEYYRTIMGCQHYEIAMCPYARGYQDSVVRQVTDLVKKTGVSGIYCDQASATPPIPCFDSTHGHPLGGGSWFVQGYRTFFKKLAASVHKVNPEAILTSESTCEPYQDILNGNLTLSSDAGSVVPIFKAVYGDYTILYGRHPVLDNVTVFNQILGEMFVNGESLGWFCRSKVIEQLLSDKYRPEAEYLTLLVKAYQYAQPFIVEGVMQRPLKLIGGETVTLTGTLRTDSYPYTVPAVMSRAYRAYDGRAGIVLTNFTKNTQSFQMDLRPSDYGFSNNNYRVTTWKNGVLERTNPDDPFNKVTKVMPAHSAWVYVIAEGH